MRVPCAFVSCSCCKDTKKMAENQRINLFSRIVKQFPHPVSSPSIALRMGLSAGCGRRNLLGHFRTARPASGHFFSHCRVVSSPFARLCLRLSAGAIAALRTFNRHLPAAFAFVHTFAIVFGECRRAPAPWGWWGMEMRIIV